MKKLLTLIVLLAVAFAYAGSYTVTTTTGQDNRLERERGRRNKAACATVGLPANCTQAQCRNVLGPTGQPLNPTCEVYANATEFIEQIVRGYANSLRHTDTSDDQAQFCAWWASATANQRNSVCSTSGLPAGCELCSGS